MTTQRIFLSGVRDGIPIALGYYAVAFSLGIIASHAGVTAVMGFIASFCTRASAGEYAGYTLAAAAASYIEVIGMSMIANLRYLLMSTALTQKFRPGTSLIKRILTSVCITDEIFGISIAYPGHLAPAYTFGAFAISTPGWALGTMSGIIAGNILPSNIVSALSVALYGMFIAIIIPPSKKDHNVMYAVIASFVFSGLCAVMPVISQWSSGARTILLTIIISAAAAIIKPIKVEEECNE